mgnify:CR=1 FL=1
MRMAKAFSNIRRSTAKVKVFLDFLRTRFPGEPQWDQALGLPPLEPGPGEEL